MNSNTPESLKQSLSQYEHQLEQVTAAIANSTEDDVRQDLAQLEQNIRELIDLTKDSLNSLEERNDSLALEYALFKAEIDAVSGSEENLSSDNSGPNLTEKQNSNSVSFEEMQDELSCLPGTKCQAPFVHNCWSGNDQKIMYHNAMISAVEFNDECSTFEDLKVRVMYVNPTEKGMIPCPFYLDGTCKYDEQRCHFSHGEIVSFSHLKEYKEPDFSLLKKNSIVLAKQKDNLWCRAHVLEVTCGEDNRCKIQFESGNKKEIIIDMRDILPLEESSLDVKPDEDDSDDSYSNNVSNNEQSLDSKKELFVDRSLLSQPINCRLGEWEKHTSGIGSRIMMSMGYVVGTGLGKDASGRIEPIEANLLPPGKSLDHCMAMKEAAGGDSNFFKVNQIQKRLRMKMANVKSKRERKTDRPEKKNMFNFLNATISSVSEDTSSFGEPSKSSAQDSCLKDSSDRSLNVAEYEVGEGIKRRKREVASLHQSLEHLAHGSIHHDQVSKKLHEARNDLKKLKSREKNIVREQNYRLTKKKLCKF